MLNFTDNEKLYLANLIASDVTRTISLCNNIKRWIEEEDDKEKEELLKEELVKRESSLKIMQQCINKIADSE